MVKYASLVPVVVVLALAQVTPSATYKILMFPFNNRSHIIEFHGVGRALMKRGHEVHIFMSVADAPTSELLKAGYKLMHPNTNESIICLVVNESVAVKGSDRNFFEDWYKSQKEYVKFTERIHHIADTLLNDIKLFEAIKQENYDFALVDTILFQTYFMAIPYKLGIPYGGLTSVHEAFLFRIPNFPSAFPDVVFTPNFGANAGSLGSSFWDRCMNVLAVVTHELWAVGWADKILLKHNITEYELRKNLAPHFIDQHHVLTDPLVTLPGVHLVGGLAALPARPVTDPKILEFIQASDAPLIVCSFGTIMEYLTPELKAKLFNAFRRVPQYRVIMRLKGDTQGKPDNVLAVDWLPQNDLLAHNKTSLFITHSGNNGQNEALYHAVPMVALHVFGDQLYNADRVARRGYGVKLNLLSFTDDDLVAAMIQVISDKSYAERTRVGSELFRLQNPGEVAAEAIENAIKYGTEHLRNDEAFDMTIVEYLMLDIVFILFTFILIVIVISAKLVAKVFRLVFF